MEALSHFAITLADYMFWPAILATVVGTIIAVISWISRDSDPAPAYGSPEYSNATWRMFASAQGIALIWIIYAILSAVPTPDYKIKTVTKVVEKTVAADYYETYSECRDVMEKDTFNDGAQGEHQFCDNKALAFVNMKPEIKYVEKVKKTVEYKTPPREVRYRTLFNMCMGQDIKKGGWSIDHNEEDLKKTDKTIPEIRNERIQLCHANIKEVLQ